MADQTAAGLPDPMLRDHVINETFPHALGCQEPECDQCDDAFLIVDRMLRAVAEWLPVSNDEYGSLGDWMERHGLGSNAYAGAVISAVWADLLTDVPELADATAGVL